MYKVVLILGLAVLLSISACSRQQSDWEKTRAANTADAYELFLKKYPSGEFSAQAQAQVKELYAERDWQKARDIDTAEAYQAFVKQYPEGKLSEEARIRIENFTLAAAPSNGAPINPAASPPTEAKAPASALSAPSEQSKPTTPKPARNLARTSPAKPSVSAVGKYAVQLGAFESGEDAANKRWANLSGKYPKLLRGLSPQVSSRSGSSTAALYRLQVVNLSRKRARAICKSLKAHSQACEVLRPAPSST